MNMVYYWKEFCVSKWVRLDNKKTCNANIPWAYIWEGYRKDFASEI